MAAANPAPALPYRRDGQPMPTHSIDLEERVLGYLMADNTLWPMINDSTFGPLAASDFHNVRHAWVFDAIARLLPDHDADFIAVKEELKRAGHPDDEVGASDGSPTQFLFRLVNHVVDIYPAAFKTYVRDLKEYAYRRLMVRAAEQLAMASKQNINGAALWEASSHIMLSLKPAGIESVLLKGKDTIRYYEQVQEQRAERRKVLMVPLKGLQEVVPALDPETFGVVSGFSGFGKTALLEAWAEYAAGIQQYRVLFAIGELTTAKMLDRRIVRHSQVPMSRVILPDDQKTDDELRAIMRAELTIDAWRDRIDYWPTNGLLYDQILAQFESFIDQGYDMIILDYIQKTFEIRDVDRTNSYIDRLRGLAEKSGVPIIVGSQLNPKLHGNDPYGSRHLHDASALHIQIVREKLKNDLTYSSGGRQVTIRAGQNGPETVLDVAKSTNTATGPVRVFYDGPCFTFRDIVPLERLTEYGDTAPLDLEGF